MSESRVAKQLYGFTAGESRVERARRDHGFQYGIPAAPAVAGFQLRDFVFTVFCDRL